MDIPTYRRHPWDCGSIWPNPKFYAACIRELPWVTRGTCNTLLGVSMVWASGTRFDWDKVGPWVAWGKTLSLLLSVLTLVLMIASTVVWLILPILCHGHRGRLGRTERDEGALECIIKKEQEIRQHISVSIQGGGNTDGEQHMEFYVTRWHVAQKTGLYLLDYFTDVITIVNYIRLKHRMFALIMGSVFARSFFMSLRHGGIFSVVLEARKSSRYNMYTDRFLSLIDVEQGVEAVPAMLMQFYTFPWMTQDSWSNFAFAFSVALSFLSTSQVVYNRFHLGLCVQDLTAD